MNRNLRKDVIFYCGLCGSRLMLQKGRHTIYYRCPKYEKEHRTNEETVCTNRISLLDANWLLDELEVLQATNELKEGKKGTINEYFTFYKSFDLSYEIKEINEDYLKVYVLNNKRKKTKYIYDKDIERGLVYGKGYIR